MSNKIIDPSKVRAKKMMLLFGLLSITMTFAGLTSAYIVSKGRPDWLVDFELPVLFFYSTILLIISSITIQFAKYNLVNNKSKNSVLSWLSFTLMLGITFCVLQFLSFKSLIEMGYFLLGHKVR
jgi:cytochrome c oxidase subunit 3